MKLLWCWMISPDRCSQPSLKKKRIIKNPLSEKHGNIFGLPSSVVLRFTVRQVQGWQSWSVWPVSEILDDYLIMCLLLRPVSTKQQQKKKKTDSVLFLHFDVVGFTLCFQHKVCTQQTVPKFIRFMSSSEACCELGLIESHSLEPALSCRMILSI